jgi:hypothetical protein
MKNIALAACIGIAIGCVAAPQANATEYDFSINLDSGPNTGTVTGTLDLPFVSGSGSGTGGASSLVLTSIPASFGTLGGGDFVTSWADQVTNTFTVTSGAITSFEFMAVTSGDTSVGDYFGINSTGSSAGSFGGWVLPGDLNELSETASIFGYNYGGAGGVTFSASATPLPSTWTMLIAGFAGLGFFAYRGTRKNAAALAAA